LAAAGGIALLIGFIVLKGRDAARRSVLQADKQPFFDFVKTTLEAEPVEES
jgi:hypothetical protein